MQVVFHFHLALIAVGESVYRHRRIKESGVNHRLAELSGIGHGGC